MAKSLTAHLLLAYVLVQDAQLVLGSNCSWKGPPLEVSVTWESAYPDGYVLSGTAAGTQIATLAYVMLRRRVDCACIQLYTIKSVSFPDMIFLLL
jgi:hypothetical protein